MIIEHHPDDPTRHRAGCVTCGTRTEYTHDARLVAGIERWGFGVSVDGMHLLYCPAHAHLGQRLVNAGFFGDLWSHSAYQAEGSEGQRVFDWMACVGRQA